MNKKSDIVEKEAAERILNKQAIFDRGILKNLAAKFLSALPIRLRLHTLFLLKHGKVLHLESPQTFNEKIAYYKFLNLPGFIECADKVLVKEYVRNKIGDEWLIPTIYSGRQLPDPDIRSKWTVPFVVKANHGSSWNLFVRTESDLNWNVIDRVTSTWLNTIYGQEVGEQHYGQITPQILVEPYISMNEHLPVDYKIYVFNGSPVYIQVDTDREFEHKRTMFDTEWNKIPVDFHYPQETRSIEPPQSLAKMLAAAAKLGKDFSFVRVDFYETNGRPFFGEMTFFPESGGGKFHPSEYDMTFGSLWKLEK